MRCPPLPQHRLLQISFRVDPYKQCMSSDFPAPFVFLLHYMASVVLKQLDFSSALVFGRTWDRYHVLSIKISQHL